MAHYIKEDAFYVFGARLFARRTASLDKQTYFFTLPTSQFLAFHFSLALEQIVCFRWIKVAIFG